jgi:hypothetical protein
MIVLLDISLPIVFWVVIAILRAVFLKSLVINLVSLPTHVILTNLVLGMLNFSFFSVVVNLFKSEISYLFLCNVCFIAGRSGHAV